MPLALAPLPLPFPRQKYRDGGRGVFRPLAFRLSGFPQPGVCEGLQQALLGMKIGGQRSVLVPPQLGFGSAAVLAPYAGVPANSMLRYDVELVRVSAKGPDAMMKVRTQTDAAGVGLQLAVACFVCAC